MDTLPEMLDRYIPQHSIDLDAQRPRYSAKAELNARVDVRCIVIANRAAGVSSPRHARP